ncbi:MAG: hypothetical protein WA005_16595 [Candidatus Binataceae bacterium]
MRYSHRGKVFSESCHSEREVDARKLLKKRIGEAGTNRLIGPSEERVTFEDLEKVLLDDYKVKANRSEHVARLALRRLREWFGGYRANDITSGRLKAYTAQRMTAYWSTTCAEAALGTRCAREYPSVWRWLCLGIVPARSSTATTS